MDPFTPSSLDARAHVDIVFYQAKIDSPAGPQTLRRREVPKPSEPYMLGDLTIDYDERRVTLAGTRAAMNRFPWVCCQARVGSTADAWEGSSRDR